MQYPRQELPDRVKWGPEKWSIDYRDKNRVNCYDTGTAPCKTACPAHIAVQGLSLIHISTAMAILSTTVIPLLNLFGMYLASWMMKKRPSEFMNAIVLYLACGIALCFLLFGNLLGAAPALIILAAATTAMIGVNTLLISVFPGRFSATGQVATISGVLNFSVYVGSALSNYGIGAVVDRFGWNAAILLLSLIHI